MYLNKRRKFFKQFHVYLIIILILLFLLIIANLFRYGYLIISVEPKDAIVLLDNAPIKANRLGKASKLARPGEHKIEAQAEGFIGKSESLKISRLWPTKLIISLTEMPKSSQLGNGNFVVRGSNDKEILYLGDQGKTIYKAIFSRSETGIELEQTPLTESKLSGINEIIWSPNKDLALFRKSDGLYMFDFKRYDFVNQTETFWGKDIGSIAWAPDNTKMAYYYTPPSGEKTLIFSNITNTEQTRVLDLYGLGIDDPILKWSSDSENLLIIPRNKQYDLDKIYVLNRFGLQLSTLTEIGNQVDATFSPDSTKLLFFTYSKDPNGISNSLVSLMNKDGSEKQSLDIRASTSSILWEDTENLLVSSFDNVTNNNKIYHFNLKQKSATGGVLINIAPSKVKLFDLIFDGTILIYQSADNLYYLPI